MELFQPRGGKGRGVKKISAFWGISRGLCVRNRGSVKVLRAEQKKQISFKELAHMICGGVASLQSRTGWEAGNSGRS